MGGRTRGAGIWASGVQLSDVTDTEPFRRRRTRNVYSDLSTQDRRYIFERSQSKQVHAFALAPRPPMAPSS